jgi:holo-[acyl-carrier protein] synthase
MIYAVGTDLVEVARIERVLEKWRERFVRRVYSGDEIRYCDDTVYPAQHFAARFAAKEAFLKSIGLGMAGGIGFGDVEVIAGARGNPELRFHGKAREMVDRAGIAGSHVSLSHTEGYAVAVVILEK